MSRSLADRIVACAGVIIVVAFFLPWRHFSAFGGPSGWTIASEGDFVADACRAVWLVLLSGLVLIASAAFGQLARVLAACAGALTVVVTIWFVARPVIPLEGGLAAAILGGTIVLAGEVGKARLLRAIGALTLAASFLLDWFGRTGYANTQPARCPHTRVTVIPWGVVIASAVALASVLAPQRAARMLARWACSIAMITVFAYVVVAYDPLTTALWATTAAGAVAMLVALSGRRSPPT
ncbi:MAG TPA: hypothetical protein VIV58_16640 [Kofleriaceae bacterium]